MLVDFGHLRNQNSSSGKCFMNLIVCHLRQVAGDNLWQLYDKNAWNLPALIEKNQQQQNKKPILVVQLPAFHAVIYPADRKSVV